MDHLTGLKWKPELHQETCSVWLVSCIPFSFVFFSWLGTTDKTREVRYTVTFIAFGLTRYCQKELRSELPFADRTPCLAFVLRVLFENFKYRLLPISSVFCFVKYLENPACSMKWLSKCLTSMSCKILSTFFCSISLYSKAEDAVFQEFCEEIGIENIRVYEQEHVRQQEELDKRRWYLQLKYRKAVCMDWARW